MGLHIVIIARGTGLHAVGGMELHTDRMAETLVDLGHRVSVVTTRLPRKTESEPARYRMFPVPGTTPNRYGRSWEQRLPATVATLLRQSPADLIVSQSTAAHPVLRVLLELGIPLVYILHGSAWESARALSGRWDPKSVVRRQRALRAWETNRRLLPLVPKLVTVSPRLAKSFEHTLNLEPERLTVLENPIGTAFVPVQPSARSQIRRRLGWGDEEFVVGYAGRITQDKGIPLLLEWIRRHPPAGGVRLALAGAGSPAQERALRDAAGRNPMTYLGRLDGDALVEFYQALDVFALPTRYFEGMPLAMLEALAVGVPPVAYATGGIGDFFERVPKPVGIPVEPGRADAFMAALDRLHADPELRLALGAEGARAVEHRRWPLWAQQLVDFAFLPPR